MINLNTGTVSPMLESGSDIGKSNRYPGLPVNKFKDKLCKRCNKVCICRTYNRILSSCGAEDKINYRTETACRGYIPKWWVKYAEHAA
ncbi:hypothetical protein LCGC14_1501770 [marine sediment metagenome]|uniref:Uncharacterized protein n=1 Tax=marine sediment metagenome TaxID=412755 RepID=A0A0F9LJL6_9ZZZZ